MVVKYGLIHDYDERNRLIQIKTRKCIEYYYLTKSLLKKYSPYLSNGLYIVFRSSDNKEIHQGHACYDINSFIRIKNNSKRFQHVYYDIDEVKEGINEILNKEEYKLFLDLEFTMPPHKEDRNNIRRFESEIIQYGMCLINENNGVVDSSSGYILPRFKEDFNDRVSEFLNITKEYYFKHAKKYKTFYDNLKYFIDKYHPQIYVWGKNDRLFLNKSYSLHNLEPLTNNANFIDLMAMIKTFYGVHNDIGLFDTYFKLKGVDQKQSHDALDDAEMTSLVFIMFQEEMNKENPRMIQFDKNKHQRIV